MKIAALSSAYKSSDIATACSTILELGFDYVEVMAYPPHTDLDNISTTADELSPYENHISGIGIYENLVDVRDAQRREAVLKTKTCIKLCSIVNGTFIVCQTGIFPSFLRDKAEKAFEKSLKEILPVAREHDVKIAFENSKNTLLSTVKDAKHFLHTYPDNSICLTVDPVNFYQSQSNPYTDALVTRTENLHIKNVVDDKEASINAGDVDFHTVLSLPWKCIFTAEYEETQHTDQYLRDVLKFLR